MANGISSKIFTRQYKKKSIKIYFPSSVASLESYTFWIHIYGTLLA